MGFQSLEQTNQKLASNPDLSDHNKEVLEDFFRKARSGGAGDATLRDYASRFNKLAELIDFSLDNPSQQELEEIVAAFNTDEIKKNNGETYADYSKNKFWKTLTKFYNSFIKPEGKGYNKDIDGPDLLNDLEMNVDLSTEVDPDALPTPKEVRKVANHTENIRDKAIILFGWATGARVGELFDTDYNDSPLLWEDLEFDSDKIWVKVKGKSGSREIPVKTSMPVMRELWEKTDASTEDPVFTKRDRTYYCPECGTKTTTDDRNSYENRTYECRRGSCTWSGGNQEVEKRAEPLTDDAVRRIIERKIEKAGLEEEFNQNPHDFFRKARAIYKARIGYSDHQMRGFFGWSETSDAPKHYLVLVKEDLEKALAEEFGEEVDYTNGYDEEALRPVECISCSTINSATRDLCKECGNGLTDQGEELTQDESIQGIEDKIANLVEDKDMSEEELREMLNSSFVDVIKALS